jgi:hypothetical protein
VQHKRLQELQSSQSQQRHLRDKPEERATRTAKIEFNTTAGKQAKSSQAPNSAKSEKFAGALQPTNTVTARKDNR